MGPLTGNHLRRSPRLRAIRGANSSASQKGLRRFVFYARAGFVAHNVELCTTHVCCKICPPLNDNTKLFKEDHTMNLVHNRFDV